MKAKVREKKIAIEMRKKGFSYKDILKVVPVSKSSLSLWLNKLDLTDSEKAVLKKRVNGNISRGRIMAAASNRNNRILREKKVFEESKIQFSKFKDNPFFLNGICLYWAEGSKRSSGFSFMNSDPEMIRFMLVWCKRYILTERNEIYLRLHTHKPFEHENLERFWTDFTGIPLSKFKKTIYKPTNLQVKKRPNYKGCLRIEISKSKNLLRKMQFWQKMLIANFKEKVV